MMATISIKQRFRKIVNIFQFIAKLKTKNISFN